MKRILGTVVAVVLAAGLGLVTPTAASAAPSGVVTSSEFFRVTQGNSIAYVRSVFGTDGKVTAREDYAGTADDLLVIWFPTYYEQGYVEVEFGRRTSGTWYLMSKFASWDNWPVQVADKATHAEFFRVKPGNSVAYARSTFGSAGTISQYLDLPGSAGDRVVLDWPTESAYGRVQVHFRKNAAGVWKAGDRRGFWDAEPAPQPDTTTESEFYRVKGGNTLDFVRSTFGSPGTINVYDDNAGTENDALHLTFPTPSPGGRVGIGFVRNPDGVWKVRTRDAWWDRSAAVTADTATEAEFDTIMAALERGETVTLDEARRVFGTAGTVLSYHVDDMRDDYPGSLLVHWYSGRSDWAVGLDLRLSGSGEWTATGTDALSGPWSG